MLVEEDPFLIQGYTFFFKRAGYEVINIIDGAEVIDAIVKHQPNIVLLDLILPGMHGFDILEIMQKDQFCLKIPIVVFSNLCQESDIEKCLSLGATDYIIKSNFSVDEVLERIEPLLLTKT